MAKSERGKGTGIGRQKGSKNKRTKELEALMEEMVPGFNPVTWMAKLAADGHDPTILEPVAGLVLILQGCKGKTANDTRKIRQAMAMAEQLVGFTAVQLDTRVACAKEVSNYLFPKRKAVEVKGDGGQLPVRVVQNFGPDACPKCGEPLK